MEIVLQEDFPALGYVGEKVSVRPGYARNYLIPRGIAVEVSSFNANVLRHKLAIINAKKIKLKAEAEKIAKSLEQVKLEYTVKVGSQGKAFGSITARDIEASLKEQGFEFDKKQLRIVDPIKGAGEYRVEIKLHSDVTVPLKVKVTAQQPIAKKEEASEEDSGKARKRRTRKTEETSDEAAKEADAEEA